MISAASRIMFFEQLISFIAVDKQMTIYIGFTHFYAICESERVSRIYRLEIFYMPASIVEGTAVPVGDTAKTRLKHTWLPGIQL